MLIYFKDANTDRSVAVNPKNVVVVFTAIENEKEVTVINTITGNLAVEMSQLEVVAQLNGAV